MSPRDRYLPVPGRKPVVEALANPAITVAKVLVSTSAQGVGDIISAAERRRVPVERAPEAHITAVAGSSRHHQGVVADVEAPRMATLEQFCESRRRGRDYATSVLVLDQIHNPANVGMLLRTAVAAGLDGVVVPDAGTASIGPVTIKASAGLAFAAPILRTPSTSDAVATLRAARFTLVGLAAGGPDLFTAELPERAAYVLGNESDGLSVSDDLDTIVSLPMTEGVESLNVAAAGSILSYELVRRRSA